MDHRAVAARWLDKRLPFYYNSLVGTFDWRHKHVRDLKLEKTPGLECVIQSNLKLYLNGAQNPKVIAYTWISMLLFNTSHIEGPLFSRSCVRRGWLMEPSCADPSSAKNTTRRFIGRCTRWWGWSFNSHMKPSKPTLRAPAQKWSYVPVSLHRNVYFQMEEKSCLRHFFIFTHMFDDFLWFLLESGKESLPGGDKLKNKHMFDEFPWSLYKKSKKR